VDSESFLPNFDKPMDWSDAAYNNADILVTARVAEKMATEGALKASLFDQALLGPSLTCSLRGMRIDHAKIMQAKLDIESRAAEGKKKFLDLVGGDVKFGKGLKPSPAELARILYRDFKVKTRLGTTDNPSVSKNILAEILEDPKTPDAAMPIVELAIELSQLEADRLALNATIGPDGRMHSSFMVSAAVSGRWGSRKDNFGEGMNLHSASDLIRTIFIPDPGKILVAMDQAQGESRVIAYLAGSKFYIDAHEAGNVHVESGKVFFPELADKFTKKWAKDTGYPGSPGKTYYDVAKSCQHACVAKNTEVLTKAGWIRVEDYDGKAEIAIWDPSYAITWESPIHWNIHEYSGPMIGLAGRNIDFLVTPNHKLPAVYNKGKRETWFHTKIAGDFNFGYGSCPLSGFLQDSGFEKNVSEWEARLLAATWADGHLKSDANLTIFGLTKKRKLDRIKHLIEMNNLTWYEHKCTPPSRHIVVPVKLRKSLDWDLLSWTKESRDAFLDELPYWDGSHVPGYDIVKIFNTDIKGLEIISTLLHLSGRAGKANLTDNGPAAKKPYYVMNFRRPHIRNWTLEVPHTGYRPAKKRIEQYSGKVYCPTTSTGWFLIRKNGLISVTGNSNYHQSPSGMARLLHIPKKDAQQIQANYFKKLPEIPAYHQWVKNEIMTKRKLVTPFGRERLFLGRVWEQSTLREAISYQPQSTVSDLTKCFLWRIFKYLDPNEVQILMEHHDSVLMMVDENKINSVLPKLEELSYIPYRIGDYEVQAVWETKVGNSWAEV